MAQPVNPVAPAVAPVAANQTEQKTWETTFNTYTVGFIDTLTSGSFCNLTSYLGLKTDEDIALKVIKAVTAVFATILTAIPAGVVWAVKSAYTYSFTKPEAAPVMPAAPPAEEPVADAAAGVAVEDVRVAEEAPAAVEREDGPAVEAVVGDGEAAAAEGDRDV